MASDKSRPYPRVQLRLDTSGGANQADAKGTNINSLIAQYKRNGTFPAVHQHNPLWGDFTFPEDIHSIREAVHQAEDRFMELPADVRTVCNNDWVEFLERFKSENGRATLEEAGLIITENPPPSPAMPIPNNSPEAAASEPSSTTTVETTPTT